MTQDHSKQCKPVESTNLPKQDELTDQELAAASGGFLVFTFKLVAVKTVSWA